MSASLPTVDRRPMPTVAIIGNDAVLAAAPATPVQLSHACLRRGFTVAVPASWGDELVATETVRRLASRERGPAVMCVCPFVRSRLLSPGPDLAPFLVSLVSPPVATARYVRAAYGDTSVHVTYIGACPSAEDLTIDDRLTPDAFLADLAEHGIALAEQPLVFDSIVPPDRRRWCSLPGGVPTAEVLWSENDTRALIEIDPDDVSTDLAQHIITREHVLLDLAPSLGCACSGSVGSLPPRSARVAVTSVEPPRALGPIMDQGVVVSLELPVRREPAGPIPVEAPQDTMTPEAALPAERDTEGDALDRRLDEMLGTQSSWRAGQVELEAELDADGAADIVLPSIDATPFRDSSTVAYGSPVQSTASTGGVVDVVVSVTEVEVAIEVQAEPAPRVDSPPVTVEQSEDAPADVRQPAPPPVPVATRHPASSMPRATSRDGRPMPRAYFAKRRMPTREPARSSEVAQAVAPQATEPVAAPTEDLTNALAHAPTRDVSDRADTIGSDLAVPVTTHLDTSVSVDAATEFSVGGTRPDDVAPVIEDLAASPREQTSDRPPRPESRGSIVAAPENNTNTLIVLVIALVTLSFFVLRSLS